MTQARDGGEGSDPQNKDFNVSRSWENSNIVRADTIYNPCNVYATECIFYGEDLTYTSEFLAKEVKPLRVWRLRGIREVEAQ